MTNWLAKAGLESGPVPIDMPVPKGPKGANSPTAANDCRRSTTIAQLSAPFGTIGTSIPIGTNDLEAIREQWNERAAIAEVEGGLSRIDAELLAWEEVKTCVVCLQETKGEADAVRVSGGGWLHLDRCYDAHLGFRQ